MDSNDRKQGESEGGWPAEECPEWTRNPGNCSEDTASVHEKKKVYFDSLAMASLNMVV